MENKENLLEKEKTTKQNRVWVRIASACNNKCIFCLDSDAQNWTFTEYDEVKKQIKEGIKEWMENRIIISWWEASINPKFAEYIKYAKEVWYDRVQTVTNGNMFFRDVFCEKVINAWLEEITFSFHGHNSMLHDYLVATPGAFKKSLKGLIYIKKHYPHIIINIDIVVNKINVPYLPDIVKFFMRLWVYEYDILQIIPFWRGFSEFKNQLFYNISDYSKQLTETWRLSRVPGMYMWTNRFHAEAFEWYEDLIQDPRKIKSETMWEWFQMFEDFILSDWEKKPECYWDACDVCFQNQYCHDFLNKKNKNLSQESKIIINWEDIENINNSDAKYIILKWEEFPSQVYKKFWETAEEFKKLINTIEIKEGSELINIPPCIREQWNNSKYEYYNDIKEDESLKDYTFKYIKNLYRKKSLRCKSCKYNDVCEGIHINFIRSYWFKILQPIKK